MPILIPAIVRWTARVMTFLVAGVFLAIAAGEPAGSLKAIEFREWAGMVLLFGAIVAMLLAWKWEFPAALFSLFALAAFAAVVRMNRFDVLAIAAIPDILFIFAWKLRRLHSPPIVKAG